MLSASTEFGRRIADNSNVELRARLTFADGEELMLSGADLMRGGMSFSASVSPSGTFGIGSAIIGQCTLSLVNHDRRFDERDFAGARVEPSVGVLLSDGTVEWVRKGVYWTEQPSSYPSTITLTALDNLSRLERDYEEVTTRYPASLRTIVMDVCGQMGVPLASTSIPNGDYVVPERPSDALTCIEVIGLAAEAAGCWARCDADGAIELSWYDTACFEREPWLDGGRLDAGTPYASGDAADGGTFDSYGAGASEDGGTMEGNRGVAVVHAISSSTVCTDDVVITGVRVTARDQEGQDGDAQPGESRLYGSEGYVLVVEDSPFVPFGKAEEVAGRIGPRVVGMRFRPFEASAVGDPRVEPGDPCVLVDASQAVHRAYLTSVKWKAGAYASYSCSAETPARNSAKGYSASTKAIVRLRKEVARERDARERALEEMAEKLRREGGVFMTQQEAENGGSVWYMHDRPELADSKVVWKMTSEVIAVSTDGGKTYPYGFDATGNAILERVYAIGLDADYITTGRLSVEKEGKPMLVADMDTGDVLVNGDSITIGSQPLPKVVNMERAVYCVCETGPEAAAKSIGSIDRRGRGTAPSFARGDVVVVTFRQPNTSSKPYLYARVTIYNADFGSTTYNRSYPILLNGEPLNEDGSWEEPTWEAGATITFVYDGNGSFEVADAGSLSRMSKFATKSEIKVLKDEISLSVSAYATKSEVRLLEDAISLKVAKGDVSSQISMESGKVSITSNRFSWSSTYSSLTEAGAITCTSGTIGGFSVTQTSIYNDLMTLDGTGLHLKAARTNVGKVGTNRWANESAKKGLVFDLEPGGAYMAWAAKGSTADTSYLAKWLYASRSLANGDGGTAYRAGYLHAGTDVDMHGYKLCRALLDVDSGAFDGVTVSTSRFLLPTSISSSGVVTQWQSGCYMKFRRGLLVGSALPQ